MGISTSTLYDYKTKFKEFSEALKRGKAPVDIEVENALLKRALGYEYEEVTTEIYGEGDNSKKHIRKVKKHVPPDTTAMIYWLKNRKPQSWRDKRDGEYSGTDDPLMVLIKRWDNASAGE